MGDCGTGLVVCKSRNMYKYQLSYDNNKLGGASKMVVEVELLMNNNSS